MSNDIEIRILGYFSLIYYLQFVDIKEERENCLDWNHRFFVIIKQYKSSSQELLYKNWTLNIEILIIDLLIAISR